MSQQAARAMQLDELRRRAAQVRARVTVRRWEYRQRRLAKGVWDRLRDVLARADVAYVVSDEEAASLIAQGLTPEPVGLQLHPPKTLLFVTAQQAERIPGRREVVVRLGEELLAACTVLLIPFGNDAASAVAE
jgi:hypothetical protein